MGELDGYRREWLHNESITPWWSNATKKKCNCNSHENSDKALRSQTESA
jgi:hypothetical protein